MPVDLTNATQVAIPPADKTASYTRRIGRWTGPAAYPTGGEVVNIYNSFAFGRLMALLLEPFSNGTVIVIARWTPAAAPNAVTSGTLKFFDMAGAEIANGTDLSTYSAYFEAIGR